MSAYTEHTAAVLVDGILYRLTADLTWHIGKEDGPAYTVPKDWTFDVSIPSFVRWIFSPHNRAYFKAAALHDHMLSNDWDRVTAASQFHQALKADGVSQWRRIVMFLAVTFYKFS